MTSGSVAMGLRAVRMCVLVSAAAASVGLGVTGAAASSFKVIYTFPSPNGESLIPAGLSAKNGDLYGVTETGGSTACPEGCGTLYKLTTQGVLTTIYSFTSSTQAPTSVLPFLGAYYVSSVRSLATISAGGVATRVLTPLRSAGSGFSQVEVDGSLLVGTAAGGGKDHRRGVIFSLSKAGVKGAYKSLYAFTGGADGGFPADAPVVVNGTLYGVTWLGGLNNSGVFYSLSPAGTETPLFSFDSDKYINGATRPAYDGAGHFYGTVNVNGTPGVTGTLYSTDMSGNRTVVHSFTTAEGTPRINVTYVNGTLYGGTTKLLYGIDANGTFKILHKFASKEGPITTLVPIGDSLYGVTAGSNSTSTVFKVTP